MLMFGFLLIMLVAVAAMGIRFLRSRGGGVPANAETGLLTLTGVSPRPEAFGEQFVTVTGNLNGPTVPGTVVYGRMVWSGSVWPAIGDTFTVVYPAGKPERWQPVLPQDPPHSEQ
ncbi:hypothetical protein [Nocardia callitridis]